MSKDAFDRRAFLKGAAASAAAVLGTQLAATNTPAQAAESAYRPPAKALATSTPM